MQLIKDLNVRIYLTQLSTKGALHVYHALIPVSNSGQVRCEIILDIQVTFLEAPGPGASKTCPNLLDNYRKIKLLAEAAEYRLDDVALYRLNAHNHCFPIEVMTPK